MALHLDGGALTTARPDLGVSHGVALEMAPDTAVRHARQVEVVAALRGVLPARSILSRGEDTTPYECGGLTAYRESPLVVVLPETEAQVSAVLKACHDLAVPVVARGAGTGLAGGALPHRLGVTLSLARFNKILAVDPLACTATVQCGVRNLAISEAAAPHGPYYAPDPSSQVACTIGGNVAENSGGVHCLKYGLTFHNVLRVRGFTASGDAIEFGSEALDAAGLDLMTVLVGSEGMLAVTTEVTVKLIPRPALARCIMASFDNVEAAGDACRAAPILPGEGPTTKAPKNQQLVGFLMGLKEKWYQALSPPALSSNFGVRASSASSAS